MQSLILSFVMRFAAAFMEIFRRSRTYRLFDMIYHACSNAWKNSIFVNVFSQDADTDSIAKTGIIYRICRLPFTFMAFLRDKLGTWLSRQAEVSGFVHMGRSILQNLLALNLRFIGVMIVGAGLSYTAIKLLFTDRGFGMFSIIGILIGLVCCIFNFNVTAAFRSSGILSFCRNALGFDFHYDIYKKKYTQGIGRLILALLIGLAMGVAAIKSPILAAAVPCGLFGMFLVLSAPITGVFFAVFAAPFVPTMVLALLCVFTMFSLFLHSIMTPYFKWKFDGMGLGLIGLLILFFISSVTSFAPLNSLSVWALYLIFMSFYFVIINTVKNKKQLYGLLKIFVIAGAFVALYGLLQYVFGWNTSNAWIDETMFENDTMRVYSTLENPNVLGEYLLLVLPIAGVFLCQYKARQLPKWVYGGITVLLFLCLILTQSRGCWLGFVLAAAVFVTFTNGRWWGLLPIALAIVPFILPQSVVERLMSIGNMEDSSTSYRVFIWFGTLAMLKDFWIGGIGMGEKAFNSVYPFYSYNAIIAPHSHNLYLQLITESGICTLIVFLVVMVVFIKKMVVVYRRDDKKSLNSMMAMAFVSGLLGFLLQSMFDYTFYNYRVMAMFFMFLAMGMALKYVTAGHERRKEGQG